MSSKKQALILVLAAQPRRTPEIRLDEEARGIEEKLAEGRHREKLRLKTCWAAQPDDVMRALSEHQPAVVHFSGHGSRESKLVLESPQGGPHSVSGEALASLFRVMGRGVKVVVLNSCYSASQAGEITRYVDAAIGMKEGIGVDAAIRFSAAFYRAVGFGKSVHKSFEEGLVAIEMYGLPDAHIPILRHREGIDPRKLFLLDAASEPEGTGGRASSIKAAGIELKGTGNVKGIEKGESGDKSTIDMEKVKTEKDLNITGIGG